MVKSKIVLNPDVVEAVLAQESSFTRADIKTIVWRELDKADVDNYLRYQILQMKNDGLIKIVKRAKTKSGGKPGDYSNFRMLPAEYEVIR